MYKGGTATPQATLQHEGVPCGDEHLRQGPGHVERHAGWHPHCLVLVHGQLLGVGATADDAHDLVADGPPTHRAADPDDPTGELQAGHLMVRGRARVEPHPLQQVGPVDRSGDHRDQNLGWSRHRRGDLARLQDLGSALAVQHDCSHGLPRQRRGCSLPIRRLVRRVGRDSAMMA